MTIFGKIIAGEIPCYKVYEDDDVLAFLDISQVTAGHTLVVPKKHVDDIFGYDETTAQKVLLKLPMIARAIKNSNPKISGINIQSNNGPSAGQTVIYSHWHLIPRYDDDGLTSTLAPTIDHSADFSAEKYQAIANAISAQFRKD